MAGIDRLGSLEISEIAPRRELALTNLRRCSAHDNFVLLARSHPKVVAAREPVHAGRDKNLCALRLCARYVLQERDQSAHVTLLLLRVDGGIRHVAVARPRFERIVYCLAPVARLVADVVYREL